MYSMILVEITGSGVYLCISKPCRGKTLLNQPLGKPRWNTYKFNIGIEYTSSGECIQTSTHVGCIKTIINQ